MRTPLTRRAAAALGLVAAALLGLAPATAHAGGFYLTPRGVRALSRGGAFVAGADDPQALWYNPAGLAYSGDQLLLDANLTLHEVTFTRVDAGGNTLEPARGYHPYVPIPTIAGSFSFDELPHLTFGLGVFAPSSSQTHWPTEPTAPQRYSVLSLEGSLLVSVAGSVAWRPIEELSLGFATHLVIGNFNAQVALSACDGVICSFPEDPEYDAVSLLELSSAFPFFVLGGVLDLDVVRIGASVSTPFNLEGQAQIRVRPPSASAFAGAEVVNRRPDCLQSPTPDCRGDTVADAQLEFPWIVRLGVEVRPVPELRLELAAAWETWSVQDAARIEPRDVWIEGALGGGLEYQVGPLNIPRNMNDTISLRLGGEYTIERMVTVRLGASYENGAFADEWLTPLTVDSDKVIVSGGVGIDVSPEVSIDVNVGYLWMAPRTVTNSQVPQSNPIRPPGSSADAVFVGNGTYEVTAPFFGLGMRWRLDAGNIRGPGEGPPADDDASQDGHELGADEGDAEEDGAEPGPGVDGPADATEPASDETEPASDDAPAGPEGDGRPWYLRGEG